MDESKPVSTLLASHFKLSNEQSPSIRQERAYMVKVTYASASGSLMYAMVCTRSDIAHAVEVVLNWITSRWPFKTVGPTFSLKYPGKEFTNKRTHKINLFEPNYEESMKWLDSREIGSVVYVSFGSVASLKEQQMEELAHGLMMSNCYFLWVVRASEENKLPPNFTSMASEKGLVLNWCPQTDVLDHRAVACFMTHCGWNSTLEALSSGVPLIAMPQWVDQTTNSKLIEDEFNVGLRVKADENGLVRREEIEMCIKQVIQGEKGKKLEESAGKWKELAKEAVDKGGSSATNVEDFVSKLLNLNLSLLDGS
ncbi:UDP-glycosyltransferase 74E2 [Abeliophyllum distichum]|uniref:anthocyanidin 3-O-glucoside 5-O-glucosyltransferase n=1 Tax=Abeliophyllum distichum TaxID=126358 RepID=A0ABD1T0B1_9LAMI